MTISWPLFLTSDTTDRPLSRKHITNFSESVWDRAQPWPPLQLKEPFRSQSTPSVAMISRMRNNLCDFCLTGCTMNSIGSLLNQFTKNSNMTSYLRRSKAQNGPTTTNKGMTPFSPTFLKANLLIAPNVSAAGTKTSPLTTLWIWVWKFHGKLSAFWVKSNWKTAWRSLSSRNKWSVLALNAADASSKLTSRKI